MAGDARMRGPPVLRSLRSVSPMFPTLSRSSRASAWSSRSRSRYFAVDGVAAQKPLRVATATDDASRRSASRCVANTGSVSCQAVRSADRRSRGPRDRPCGRVCVRVARRGGPGARRRRADGGWRLRPPPAASSRPSAWRSCRSSTSQTRSTRPIGAKFAYAQHYIGAHYVAVGVFCALLGALVLWIGHLRKAPSGEGPGRGRPGRTGRDDDPDAPSPPQSRRPVAQTRR